MAASASAKHNDDMSWSEVGQLGLQYGKIPLALLAVEALYWFITQPSDTLAFIQVTEAYIWNEVTQLMFGESASTLSSHSGWMTRIDFYHESFPGQFDSVGLYVSDECAGIHEMIFISTLILMTDGVSQRQRFKAVGVMCALVYVLNIVRLVAFYPIAVDGCLANPDQAGCLNNMWEYHNFVYKWGFLIVLLLMWLVWFRYIGAGSRTLQASQEKKEQWRIIFRRRWSRLHYGLIITMVTFFLISWMWINANAEATEAKDVINYCEFSELTTGICIEAQADWDNAIQGAWSFAVLGLVLGTAGIYEIERKDDSGEWPERPTKVVKEPAQATESKSKEKPKGSWRNRSNSSEEE
jgi:exosortase/archaeosortase family protein